MSKKGFAAFAVRSQRSGGDGSLGFKVGEIIKVENIFRDGKTFPLVLDKKGRVVVTHLDRFYGYNQRKQKGWFSTKSVDISYDSSAQAGLSSKTISLSKQQMSLITKQFSNFDKDNDGKLNLIDTQAALKTLGHNLSRAKTQELMHLIDYNCNGMIDLDQFAEMMRLQLESGRRKTHSQKSKAATIIQRCVRMWLVHLTMPYPVPGPKLVNWAKEYKLKGEKAARHLLDDAMIEQGEIRAEQWNRLTERNEERRRFLAKKRQAAEVRAHGDNKNALLKVILLEVFTEVVNQMAVNICEEVTGKKIGSAKATEIAQASKLSKEEAKELSDVVRESQILSVVQKNGASSMMYHVQTKEQRSYLLLAVLTNRSATEMHKKIVAAKSMPAGTKLKDVDREMYQKGIDACKATQPQKAAASNAMKGLITHDEAGQILLALLRGDSPYAINRFVKAPATNQSEDDIAMSIDDEVQVQPLQASKGDKHASPEMTLEFRAAITNAITYLPYQQVAALNLAAGRAKTHCQQAGVLIDIILEQPDIIIRRDMHTKAGNGGDDWGRSVKLDGWKTNDKDALLDVCKKSDLSRKRKIFITKGIKASTKKSEVFNILIELCERISQIKVREKAEKKRNAAGKKDRGGGKVPNSSVENKNVNSKGKRAISASKRKLDKSQRLKPSDISAMVGCIMYVQQLSPVQRRGAKLATQNAETMADLIIILSNIIALEGPDNLEESTENYGNASRTLESMKELVNNKSDSSPIFNGKIKQVIKNAMKVCQNHKAIVSVLQAAIAGKGEQDILESPSKLSDGDKTLFLSILNKCRQIHSHPKLMDVAKRCAISAVCYGEQATILDSVINCYDPKICRKNANVAAVDGTRKRTEMNEKERNRTINTLEKSDLEESQKDILMDGLGYAQTFEQLSQLLGAALLRAPTKLMEKMIRPWEPKTPEGRKIKINGNQSYLALEPHQQQSAILCINTCTNLTPNEKKVAVEVISAAKTHIHVLAILVAIVAGRSTNKYRKALYDTSEHVSADTMTKNERDILIAAVKTSRYAGAKKKAAVDALLATQKAPTAAAILAFLMAGKSPYQILNASMLGIEKKIATKAVKTEEEEKKEETEKQNEEIRQRYRSVLCSSVLSSGQKEVAIECLKNAPTSTRRVEILLRVFEHQQPDDIKEAMTVRGLNRSLTEAEKDLIIDRLESGNLTSDHVGSIRKLIKQANTKKEVETVLNQAISWLNYIHDGDKEELLSAVNSCKFLTKEKKVYGQQWIRKVDTRSRLLLLVEGLLRWQIRPLHWVGIAYEEIFQTEPLVPMSPDAIASSLAAIADCNSPDDIKKMGKKAVKKAAEEQDIINILIGILKGIPAEKLESLIKTQVTSVKSRQGMKNKYKRKENGSPSTKREKKKKEKKKKKSVVGDEDDTFYEDVADTSAAIASANGRGSFQNLKARALERIRGSQTISPNMREALIVIGQKILKKEELEEFNRLARLLSSRDRANDLNARTEEASMQFMNFCYALIDNDPSIEFTEAKEEKKKFLSRAKTYLEAVTCVWEEEKVVTGPARFQFKASVDNADFDTKCSLSQNDKHEIMSYIEKDKDVTDDALKAATRKGILSACKTRSQAMELMELYDNVSTTRQIAAACRKFRAQGYGTRTQKKKSKIIDKSAELLELKQKNKEAAEAILLVAGILDLSDYQRASAVRAASNSTDSCERASILQAVLAREDPKTIRNAKSSRHNQSDSNLLEKLLDQSPFPEDAKLIGKSEASEMECEDDRANLLVTTFRAAKKISDMHQSETPDEPGVDLAHNVDQEEKVKMLNALITIRSFSKKQKLIVREALTKLKTYEQLTYVLLGLIKKSGRKEIMKAAVMDDDPNLTIETQHIHDVKNIVQQSHMMELLHRDHHSDIEAQIRNATSYNSLSAALYKFIECYANIVEAVHTKIQNQRDDDVSPKEYSSMMSKRYVANDAVEEKKMLKLISKSQHIRVNAGISHFPSAKAPMRKLAGREAATAKTVAHLVEIAMIFLQTVAEDTDIDMVEFEAQLSKARNMTEFASDDVTDADKLILREITLSIPNLSNTEVAASQAKSLQTKQDMLDLIEVILKEPIFGTRKMRELSSYCGASSAVYSSEINNIETKNDDEWDSWDNYNITEFVDDDSDAARGAHFVTDGNGYTNYSPVKPQDGVPITSPISNARKYSLQSETSPSTHLKYMQNSANSYGAKPTTPTSKAKEAEKVEKSDKQKLKDILQTCTRPVAKKLFNLHKKSYIDILDFGKSGVILELNKMLDSKQKIIILQFEKGMIKDGYDQDMASDFLLECIQASGSKK